MVIRAKTAQVRGTEQGPKFSFVKSSSRPSKSSRDAHPSIEPPSQDVATSSNTAETTRPERGMSSESRVPASGKNVPKKFEFSRSAEPKRILDEDWDDAYYASERWAEEWVVTQDPDRPEWLLGLKIYQHKMYWYEKLCVPETVTGRVIRAHHAEIGHVGGKIVERNAEMVTFSIRRTSQNVGRNHTWTVRKESSTQSDEVKIESDNRTVHRATNVRRTCKYRHIQYAQGNMEWRNFRCHGRVC